MKFRIKIMILALLSGGVCCITYSGKLNPRSTLGIAAGSRGDMVRKVKLTSEDAVDTNSLDNKDTNSLDNKIAKVENALNSVDLEGSAKGLNDFEQEAIKTGFWQKWIANPTNMAYNATVGRFASAVHTLADKVMSTRVNKSLTDIVTNSEEIVEASKIFNGEIQNFNSKGNPFAPVFGNSLVDALAKTSILPSVKVEISISNLKANVETALKNLNDTIIANASEAERQKFIDLIQKTVPSMVAAYSYFINITSLADPSNANTLAAIKANKQANSNLKLLLKNIIKPIADTMNILVSAAQAESTTLLVTPLLTPSMISQFDTQYKKLIDLGTALGLTEAEGWTRMDIVKWCAVGTGIALAAYACYKNKDLIKEKVGNFTIPSRADMSATVKAAPGAIVAGVKNIPGALKGSAVYLGDKVKNAAAYGYSFVPSLEGTINAIKSAPSAVVGLGGAAVGAVKSKMTTGVSNAASEISSGVSEVTSKVRPELDMSKVNPANTIEEFDGVPYNLHSQEPLTDEQIILLN